MYKKYLSENCKINSNNGEIYLAGNLQGRIFVTLDGELMHKLDENLVENPVTDTYNNIGGNILWPAPEGGEFAFNYKVGTGDWYVQEAINMQENIVECIDDKLIATKKLNLINFKGVETTLLSERCVKAVDLSQIINEYNLKAVGYCCVDKISATEVISVDDFVFSSWTLEQFYGNDGVTAFGKVKTSAKDAINNDFYGDANPRLEFHGDTFLFKIGGTEKMQIGIDSRLNPEFIGAYIPEKDLLIIRQSPLTDGTYINIADNAQENGVYSAADKYSIFNGADLGFFELETIAPMTLGCENNTKESILESTTLFLRGSRKDLTKFMMEKYSFNMEVI